MYGFNVTRHTFPYDNRPVAPLMHRPFSEWWYHGHLDYPPHPEDVTELPAGQDVTMQIACDKAATTYYASAPGGNIQEPNNPNNVCPGSPPTQYHTSGENDVKGCALAIAYKSNAADVTPEDFVVFSVNHVCVWNRYTNFPVPKDMPPCPNNKCQCAFFWVHSPNSGAEQSKRPSFSIYIVLSFTPDYMNGFQCDVTGSTSHVGLATPQVPRRCGADPDYGKPDAAPGNCTYGAKQPFYWFQAERNNVSFPSLRSCPCSHRRYRCLKDPTPLLSTTIFTISKTELRTISSKVTTIASQNQGQPKPLFQFVLSPVVTFPSSGEPNRPLLIEHSA